MECYVHPKSCYVPKHKQEVSCYFGAMEVNPYFYCFYHIALDLELTNQLLTWRLTAAQIVARTLPDWNLILKFTTLTKCRTFLSHTIKKRYPLHSFYLHTSKIYNTFLAIGQPWKSLCGFLRFGQLSTSNFLWLSKSTTFPIVQTVLKNTIF